eukprot:TRINITY_DN15667_c0_g1_i1.p1 TRINITY_DN15667_c0_g1~~TRINITY_DN15667_c0_g1_i1.p1  ORF type:complete len:582 (+),score=112.93 TRINITY_DN15667_c0_g1_i1:77-1822(+)
MASWKRSQLPLQLLLLLSLPTFLQSAGPEDDSQCPCDGEEAPTFRFFLHPHIFETDGVLSAHYKSLYDTLAKHAARTDVMSEADVHFLGLDVACELEWPSASVTAGFVSQEPMLKDASNFVHGDGSVCRQSRAERLDRYLKSLGTLQPAGIRHVVFDMLASAEFTPEPVRLHDSIVLASPGVDKLTYRSDTDVAFPPLPRFWSSVAAEGSTPEGEASSHFLDLAGRPPGDSTCDSSRWTKLLVFRGAETSVLRREVASSLHDGQQIVVELSPWEDSMAAVGGRLGTVAADAQSHVELLRSSKFALAPAGGSAFSYAVVEAACAGSVPVILSDRMVPPFSEAGGADYAAFTVQVEESRFEELPEILRQYSDADVCAMQRAALEACEKHFLTFGRQVRTLLNILARRLYKTVRHDASRADAAAAQTPPAPPAIVPDWPAGPWVTFDCGVRLRLSALQERQVCKRCLSAHGLGWPVCEEAQVARPPGTSEDAIRQEYRVGQLCEKQGADLGGCLCRQGSQVASLDFSSWRLVADCDVQTFQRWFDCGGSKPGEACKTLGREDASTPNYCKITDGFGTGETMPCT